MNSFHNLGWRSLDVEDVTILILFSMLSITMFLGALSSHFWWLVSVIHSRMIGLVQAENISGLLANLASVEGSGGALRAHTC